MVSSDRIRQKMKEIAEIIASAGGRFVGRTRLQKTIYLLKEAGLSSKFRFEYKHYGPFSEDIAALVSFACMSNLMSEQEEMSNWGGTYSIYRSDISAPEKELQARKELINIAANANPIELELAATALFLSKEGYQDPWAETAERKPEKVSGGRLRRAKALYRKMQLLDTPEPLPNI